MSWTELRSTILRAFAPLALQAPASRRPTIAPIIVLVGIAMSTSVVGCGAEQAKFELEFAWGPLTPPAATDELDVYATVIRSDGRTEANNGLPVSYAPGVQLSFDEVVFGRGLVVEVRIADRGSPAEATPKFFGQSEPFDFLPGDRIKVPVAFEIGRGPRFATQASTPGDVVAIRSAVAGRTNNPMLRLDLSAIGVERIEVAQDVDFSLGFVSYDASSVTEQIEPMTGVRTISLLYDLNSTRADCAADEQGVFPVVCEGERRILVRLVGGRFVSRPVEARTVLDTQPPSIAAAAVLYRPGPTNPLATVAKATTDTEVIVTVNFSEPIDAVRLPLRLLATNGIDALTFELEARPQGAATSATFRATVAAGMTDGIYVPSLQMQDLAGNLASDAAFQSPLIELDLTPDQLLVQQDRVSFIRSPFGNAAPEDLLDEAGNVAYTLPSDIEFFALGPADGLAPQSNLPGQTFRLQNGVFPAQIRVWAERTQRNLLGTATRGRDGNWPRDNLRLTNQNTPRVYVTGLDNAGNESEPVLIRNNWYVGSTVQSATAVTPHRTATALEAKAPLTAGNIVSDDLTVSGLDGAARVVRSRSRWVQETSVSPAERSEPALAFDSARGQVILFGGIDSGFFADTWVLDGNQWIEVTPDVGNPRARYDHAMVYDSRRGRVVMFGGTTVGATDDTWEWDGMRWTDVTPNDRPPARSGHAMAFDSVRGRVVLFGGTDFVRDFGDTWEWDGVAWRNVTPPSGSPSPRAQHAMAYDSGRGIVVMVGGGQTWEWDGAMWTDRTADSTQPAALAHHSLVYDSTQERVVLFGGRDADQRELSDSWGWDGQAWARIASPEAPSARSLHASAFDSIRGRTVVFGGQIEFIGNFTSELWTLDHGGWQNRTRSNAFPSARGRSATAYDQTRGRMMMFGGASAFASTRFDELWAWNGSAWNSLAVAGLRPPAVESHAMVYDTDQDQLVLFGGFTQNGFSNQVWVYGNGEWQDLTPPTGGPPARFRHGMAYDQARQEIVVFGGRGRSRFADTWTWNGTGTTWVLHPAGNDDPPARGEWAAAYDAIREVVVLYSGVDSPVWEWNGAAWRSILPATQPPARSDHRLAYDAARQRVVLFGGTATADLAPLNDVWLWDGQEWVERSLPFGPEGRSSPGFDYDGSDLIVFGGLIDLSDFATAFDDTWRLAPVRAPVVQFDFELPPDLATERFLDVRVRAACFGGAATSGQGAAGAELTGWTVNGAEMAPGTWSVLGQNNAETAASDGLLIDYRPASDRSADTAKSLVFEDLRKMYFQCRPVNRAADAVGLDYLEVRVKYLSSED